MAEIEIEKNIDALNNLKTAFVYPNYYVEIQKLLAEIEYEMLESNQPQQLYKNCPITAWVISLVC